MDLIDAAKRTGKVDPESHLPDAVTAWAASAPGTSAHTTPTCSPGSAPSPARRSPSGTTTRTGTSSAIQAGVLPNLFNIRLHVYQSLDDKNVPPAENQGAIRDLKALKEQFPDGFDFRYHEVDGRGHGAPPDGYLPDLKWLHEK